MELKYISIFILVLFKNRYFKVNYMYIYIVNNNCYERSHPFF